MQLLRSLHLNASMESDVTSRRLMMKVIEALKYNDAIRHMIDNTPVLDSYVKFKLLGVIKLLEPTVENYNKVREDIILKHSTSRDDGSIGIFEPNREDFTDDADYEAARKDYEAARDAFSQENAHILDSEADITLPKINYREIMNSGLSSADLTAIYDLIEE